MNKKLGFLIDVEKCVGCRTCEMSCIASHTWNRPFRRLQQVNQKSSDELRIYYVSLGCHHCEDPECIRVCKENAYYKRKDGIVVHDIEKCRGCLRCVKACPFSAPQFHPALGIVDKCDMCSSRMDEGKPAICVSACPTAALTIIDFQENESLAAETLSLPNSFLTRPTTRFKQPKRQKQWFI